jgi:hypothetical protein
MTVILTAVLPRWERRWWEDYSSLAHSWLNEVFLCLEYINNELCYIALSELKTLCIDSDAELCPEITKYNEDNRNITPATFYSDITPYFFVKEVAASTRRLGTKWESHLYRSMCQILTLKLRHESSRGIKYLHLRRTKVTQKPHGLTTLTLWFRG